MYLLILKSMLADLIDKQLQVLIATTENYLYRRLRKMMEKQNLMLEINKYFD